MKPAPGVSSASTLRSACTACARPARFDRSVRSWMRWKRLCQVEGSGVRIEWWCGRTFGSFSLFLTLALVLPSPLHPRHLPRPGPPTRHSPPFPTPSATHAGNIRPRRRSPARVGAAVTDRAARGVLGTQTRGFGCGGEQGEVEGRGGFALVVAVVRVLVADMFVVSLRDRSVEGGRKGGSGEVEVEMLGEVAHQVSRPATAFQSSHTQRTGLSAPPCAMWIPAVLLMRVATEEHHCDAGKPLQKDGLRHCRTTRTRCEYE
ncbi:hypothetical protein IWX49DRAFT_645180 [Phyllosticta citricarpa]|uniref:Uncharacterized protein n=2 Tax=Phyllosticta TaxID=121621 RepID=A0ABR1M6U6_9PEZI